MLEHRETPNQCCYIRIQEKKLLRENPLFVPKPNKCHYQDNMEKKLHRKNQTHSYCSDMTNIYCSQETQTIEFATIQFENITGKTQNFILMLLGYRENNCSLNCGQQNFLHNTRLIYRCAKYKKINIAFINNKQESLQCCSFFFINTC